MNKNVYVRSNRSIMTISLTRILILVPLIIYGIYKNGIYLYRNKLVSGLGMFKPIIIIFGGAVIAAIVNFLYEYFYKGNKQNSIIDNIFSSFHVEYAILLGCIMSINVNLLIYFIVLTIVIIASKFIDDKINTVCIIFLIIYAISYFMDGFSFLNIYESSKTFSYEFIDYLIGRAPGGLASTHVILIIAGLIGLTLTNNNKTTISLSSIITYIILVFGYAIVTKNDFSSILFCYNYLFIASFIATDSLSSCYTSKGMFASGILIALISFGFYFINPVIAPIVGVLIVSVFSHFIDKKIYELSQK